MLCYATPTPAIVLRCARVRARSRVSVPQPMQRHLPIGTVWKRLRKYVMRGMLVRGRSVGEEVEVGARRKRSRGRGPGVGGRQSQISVDSLDIFEVGIVRTASSFM